MFETANPALLIVDVQLAIDSYSALPRCNPNAEELIGNLLRSWRKAQLPIVHIRHASKFADSAYHSGSATYPFKSQVFPEPGEKIVTKQENSAFIATELENHLRLAGATELVICGVTTNHSVDATVRVAAGLGFRVFVPSDATAAFAMQLMNGGRAAAEEVHGIFLSNLNGEYCRVCCAGELLAAVAKPAVVER